MTITSGINPIFSFYRYQAGHEDCKPFVKIAYATANRDGRVGQRRSKFHSTTPMAALSTFFSQIFGPVLAIGKFSTEEDAITLANDTSYGLGAGLHSSEISAPLNFDPDHVYRHACFCALV